MVDRVAARTKSRNSFTAWKEVTPVHNQLVDTIIASKMHQIATLRVKTEWVLEKDERTGKTVPRKVGTQPVMRDGIEYEFDVVADLDAENNFIVSKTRCPALNEFVGKQVGPEVASTIWEWLRGSPAPAQPVPQPSPVPPPAPQPPAQAAAANVPPRVVTAEQVAQEARAKQAPPAPPPANGNGEVPEELQALWRQMTDFKSTVQVILDLKRDIEEVTGSDRGYYEIIYRHGLKHGNDLKGKTRGKIRQCVKELFEYLRKCQQTLRETPAADEEPAPPYQATDEDLPVEVGGTWTEQPAPAAEPSESPEQKPLIDGVEPEEPAITPYSEEVA